MNPVPAVIHVTIDQVALNTMVETVYAQGVEYELDGSPNPGEPYPAGYRTIADLVVEQVLRKVMDDRDRWDGLRARVTAIRDEAIREAVTPLVAEALTTPFPRTNSFGEPVGQDTTLRELIQKQARTVMSTKVAVGRDGAAQTTLEHMVADAVATEFRAFIAGEVKVVKDALSRTLATEATVALQNVVKNALAGR